MIVKTLFDKNPNNKLNYYDANLTLNCLKRIDIIK